MNKKILILGGGFAGIEAAIKLNKYNYDVSLVSNRDYLFIYPISIWIPVHKKQFSDVAIPLERLAKKHNFKLIIDNVKSIISKENKVELGSSSMDYDYLIIAMGMSKVKSKGLEFTHSICGDPNEAVVIKDELDKLIERGNGKIAIGFGANPKDSSATAVRGGPAFELLFNFSHHLKKKKVRSNFEITFFAPMKEPGKKMGSKAYNKMDAFFKHYNIKSKKGVKIQEFVNDGVLFEDGSKLESDLTLFISGGTGHPVVYESDLPITDAGFIKIDDNCKVDTTENVYAIGDISALEGPSWAAKQGHIAEVMADVAAFNIHHNVIGSEKRKGYHHHLNIVCLMDSGDGAAFVIRKADFDMILPMPIVGHWLKKGWGFYYKYSKLGMLPRIPGM
ncbi:MAG: FAD-dependent oxidoreductase [Bacteroidota bacterium]